MLQSCRVTDWVLLTIHHGSTCHRYDVAVSTAPSPLLHASLLHVTVATWHLALFSLLGRLLPTALPLQPPLEAGLSLLPTSAGSAVGLVGLSLFGAAAANLAAGLVTEATEATETSEVKEAGGGLGGSEISDESEMKGGA